MTFFIAVVIAFLLGVSFEENRQFRKKQKMFSKRSNTAIGSKNLSGLIKTMKEIAENCTEPPTEDPPRRPIIGGGWDPPSRMK